MYTIYLKIILLVLNHLFYFHFWLSTILGDSPEGYLALCVKANMRIVTLYV